MTKLYLTAIEHEIILRHWLPFIMVNEPDIRKAYAKAAEMMTTLNAALHKEDRPPADQAPPGRIFVNEDHALMKTKEGEIWKDYNSGLSRW